MDWLEQIDHTADVGIIVRAPDLPMLFSRAALGMFTVITDIAEVRPVSHQEISIEAEDLPSLLHAWLSELNFLHITRHELYAEFAVGEFSQTHLRAGVAGEKIDPRRHAVYTETKAVTFHGLSVERTDGGWEARIIFDM